jgi:hypothetical protein
MAFSEMDAPEKVWLVRVSAPEVDHRNPIRVIVQPKLRFRPKSHFNRVLFASRTSILSPFPFNSQ